MVVINVVDFVARATVSSLFLDAMNVLISCSISITPSLSIYKVLRTVSKQLSIPKIPSLLWALSFLMFLVPILIHCPKPRGWHATSATSYTTTRYLSKTSCKLHRLIRGKSQRQQYCQLQELNDRDYNAIVCPAHFHIPLDLK